MVKPDFSGYATRNDLKCSDGRTIRRDAFKDDDGQRVPLVWQHMHDSADNVLGHADLENREDGVYAYCFLNDTSAGQNAKKLVAHGDISAMSIYANKLVQKGSDVLHGAIREVSLVLSGANPGATIDTVALDYVEIRLVVGRRWRDRGKVSDIGDAARLIQTFFRFQLIGQSYEIDRFSRIEDLFHRADDQLM